MLPLVSDLIQTIRQLRSVNPLNLPFITWKDGLIFQQWQPCSYLKDKDKICFPFVVIIQMSPDNKLMRQ